MYMTVDPRMLTIRSKPFDFDNMRIEFAQMIWEKSTQPITINRFAIVISNSLRVLAAIRLGITEIEVAVKLD